MRQIISFLSNGSMREAQLDADGHFSEYSEVRWCVGYLPTTNESRGICPSPSTLCVCDLNTLSVDG